jgi:photosystem II stability/assembly factor-like uncharacterized protein
MAQRSARILLALVLTLACAFLVPRFRGGEAERESDRSGARESLDFWTLSRAYPKADIPAASYYAAYTASHQRIKEVSRTLSASSIWEPIGPLNLQGRTLFVALNPQNPNTVFVGTASGGLWRSRTEGKLGDWERIPLGYPALGVGAIAIDPADSNTIYIGTGEVYQYQQAIGGLIVRTTRGSYGIGLLKTTNGGVSWTKSIDWTMNQERGIQQLVMNPVNPRTLFAATTEGIYKTTDAGANWTNTLPIIMGMDIVLNLADTNKVMVSMGNFSSPGVGIYTSTDAGLNWVPSGGLPAYSGKTMLGRYASNANVVYASVADSTTGVGSLWKTTNFGGSWTMLPGLLGGVFGVQGWYSHIIAAHPTDPLQIFHAGVPAGKSVNGGTSFSGSSGSYSDHHGYAIHPTNPNILYVVNDDGIYRSTNFGASFANVGFGMQSGQFYNGFSNSSQDSLLSVGQSQDHIPGYLYSGATTWTRSVSDEVGWTAIDPTNDNYVYADSRYGGGIIRSTDRGLTFSTVANFGGTGAWNSPFVVAPSAPNTLYFGDQVIYRSTAWGSGFAATNGGAPLDGNPSLSMAVSATDPNTVYVGTAPTVTSPHVFSTTNGGGSWNDVTGALPDRYPMDLAVDPSNAAVVYVAMGGFGSGHFFKSTTGGGSWTDISGTLPDVPGTAVAVDPLNTSIIYAGNDIGVYVSTNGGASWAGFSDGLPDAAIAADLAVSPSNRALRIATHGNGVYERSLLGELPASYFDYRVLALTAPVAGAEVLFGTTINPIIATFRNSGTLAPPDSVDVTFRILKGELELYADTKRIAPLAVGESRQVTFSGGYYPPQPDVYDIQASVAVADSNGANDTLKSSFTVFLLPNVASPAVTKEYCPYVEITGGTAGPSGDDVQMSATLPFSFSYDGYSYDKIQISTNGWVELGTGTSGTVRGLSTSGQLGGFYTQALGTTARPTKVLAPWWTDLATGSIGAISYKFTGIAPDRVATIQWKSVAANYDEGSTTMKLNFQVVLHEGTNIVEFRYGPRTAGTYNSGNTGASSGIKDHIGGNYHYFDLSRMGSGLSEELNLALTPVTDWPGADSCYQINLAAPSGETVRAFPVRNKWNLVSVPLTVGDLLKTSLFPFATSSAYAFDGGYTPEAALEYGRGYWLKFSAAQTVTMSGALLAADTIDVAAGWNLVGSLSESFPVTNISSIPGGLVTSDFFGYTGSYVTASVLDPGMGYWVKVASAGQLVMTSAGPANAASRIRIALTGEVPPAPPDAELASDGTLPKEFGLAQNYPNPFNPTTAVSYQLPADSKVKIVVYDLVGQVVATLVDGVVPAGYQETVWRADHLASGVYFYKMEATALDDPGSSFTRVMKMLLLR